MPTTYDRTALREAASRRGDINANRVARTLGCGRETAYRLWRGQGRPSAPLAAEVQRAYRVPLQKLLVVRRDEQTTEPAA
jgi:hypothetical protein